MNTSAQDFLRSLARLSESTREQGHLFEKLTQQWLAKVPPHADRYREVWLWGDWARQQRLEETDTGIDLVARTHDDEYCAIQCKFFDSEHRLQKSDIDSFFTASGRRYGGIAFSERKIVATTAKWSAHAEDALRDQTIECTRLDFSAELEAADIDWHGVGTLLPPHDEGDATTNRKLQPAQARLDIEDTKPSVEVDFRGLLEKLLPKAQPGQAGKKQLRPHQQKALRDVVAGFEDADRGKLIMACGTGKTFTALKIAEQIVPGGGTLLFLVPSLALLSQSLREWSADSERPLRNFVVCSDAKVGRNNEDIKVHDLAIPATTDAGKLAQKLRQPQPGRTNVVFATYHSIQVVADAQQQGAPAFDLIICDEAHRTTGVESKGEESSYFTKVHDGSWLAAKKRLYMTATPRIYTAAAKSKAEENDYDVISMDDPEQYGEELHRLDFSSAVDKGLLSDYKVLILAVNEEHISAAMQAEFAAHGELNLNDAVKIIGCWKGLAKQIINAGEAGITDATPMRRAVAFTQTINASKHIADNFAGIVREYIDRNPGEELLQCKVQHVDGTQNALVRNKALHWLKQEPEGNGCHVLSNVRCLSEGVDVPALDAVMFLNPRKSQVDVVQSVGRVMRKAEGKDYGYIILPIGVAANASPEEALNDNEKYRVVWDVLQALRAHDNRFNAEINRIELNDNPSDMIDVIGVGFGEDGDGDGGEQGATDAITPPVQPGLLNLEAWRGAIYARMVLKCGDRRYWETWAKDVADIARRNTTRIKTLVAGSEASYRELFEEFLTELRQNINPSITEDDAIDMLSQHIITRPVFDALFGDSGFSDRNPVSKTMQTMLELLDEQNLARETESLEKFYASVRQRAEGIDNAAGKQKVIAELYEKFFRTAFPKVAESLGIVYTPVEVVDFIIHSVDELLQQEFGKGITARDVHILDPFAGTGTFITRLLQSETIKDEDLPRKYRHEIHANEILLLAYYIAAVNIEQVYYHQAHNGKQPAWEPFEGIALTDTFQINERDGDMLNQIFPVNSARVERQKQTPIWVVFGNPPWSTGQKSENDASKNLAYPKLDASIAKTYAEHSSAVNKNSLYDSYIRAVRWAGDRIGNEGIVACVTNGGYIDGNAMDGLRKCLREEFSSIYCFNLRGNQRTAGEISKKEGGKIFGSGSRAGVAILFLIKNPGKSSTGNLNYYDIGDYLDRRQKLNGIKAFGSVKKIPWEVITPDKNNDWINQQNPVFQTWLPLGDKANKGKYEAGTPSIFLSFSNGMATNRDAWVYNFSQDKVSRNMQAMIALYNDEVVRWQQQQGESNARLDVNEFVNNDSTKISWSSSLKASLERGVVGQYDASNIRPGIYRPFTKCHVYFDNIFIHRPAVANRYFPTPDAENLAICVSGVGASKEFSALMVDMVPNLHFLDSSQCFPRYTWENPANGSTLFNDATSGRIDNIPQSTVALFREHYRDAGIIGDHIFYYVYGILHNPTYKTRFAADLKKTLPRIPYAPTAADFHACADAGRQLADLHVHYETAEPYPLLVREQNAAGDHDGYFRVHKMKYAGADKSRIQYNDNITIEGIPPEAHDYIVNGKSALDWIIDRYQIKTDKDSKITNDPNDWSDSSRHIIDLIRKVTTVSVKTVRIIGTLPALAQPAGGGAPPDRRE